MNDPDGSSRFDSRGESRFEPLLNRHECLGLARTAGRSDRRAEHQQRIALCISICSLIASSAVEATHFPSFRHTRSLAYNHLSLRGKCTTVLQARSEPFGTERRPEDIVQHCLCMTGELRPDGFGSGIGLEDFFVGVEIFKNDDGSVTSREDVLQRFGQVAFEPVCMSAWCGSSRSLLRVWEMMTKVKTWVRVEGLGGD